MKESENMEMEEVEEEKVAIIEGESNNMENAADVGNTENVGDTENIIEEEEKGEALEDITRGMLHENYGVPPPINSYTVKVFSLDTDSEWEDTGKGTLTIIYDHLLQNVSGGSVGSIYIILYI